MGFSRQEYWSGLPCPPPGDLPNPGIKLASLRSPAPGGRFFTTNNTWEFPEKFVIWWHKPSIWFCLSLKQYLWSTIKQIVIKWGMSVFPITKEIWKFYLKPNSPMRSVQFNLSVMSDSLRAHGLQHASLHCPSPSPGAYSNSRPLSQWCHPTFSSSVIPFSSHLQSFPASGSFQMS